MGSNPRRAELETDAVYSVLDLILLRLQLEKPNW